MITRASTMPLRILQSLRKKDVSMASGAKTNMEIDGRRATPWRLKLLTWTVIGVIANHPSQAFSQVVTQFTYDPGNDVSSITDPRGLVTSYAYDGLGQKWQQVSPDSGTTSYAYSASQLTTMTRANGVQTHYYYDGDPDDRISRVMASGKTQFYDYDDCGNGLGRLCGVSDSTGATAYDYTPEGRIADRSFGHAATTFFKISYGYDAMGHVASITYPDQSQLTYHYTRGVIDTLTLQSGGKSTTIASGVIYRPGDQGMASWTSSNGLVNTLSYDGDARLTSIVVPGIQNLGFKYDVGDRVTQIANGIDATMTQNFGYDTLSRLTSVASPADNESFQYDANGNRIAQTINGAAATLVTSTTSNQMTMAYGSYSFLFSSDPNGNAASVPTANLTYDAFNRMSAANGANYYVNPEGQRLSKTVGTTTTYFASDRSSGLLAESTASDPLRGPLSWNNYLYLNGRLIGMTASGAVDAIHADQLGRPEEVTDATKTVVWRARNLAFDRTVTISNLPSPLNLGFPGQYYDIESGLWNNGYRDYSAALGRYVESDPIGLRGGLNTYAYVDSSPITFIDPPGLIKWNVGIFSVGGSIAGIIGGGVGRFTAISECVDGKRAMVSGTIKFADGGLSPVPLGFSGSNGEMEDGLDHLDPQALSGVYASEGAQYVLGAGVSYGSTRLGSAYSGAGWSPAGGISFGTTAAVGRSTVTSVSIFPEHP